MVYTAGCSDLEKPDFNGGSYEEVSTILVRSGTVEDTLTSNAEFQVNSRNSVDVPDSSKEDQAKMRAQRNSKNIVQDESDDEEGGLDWNALSLHYPALSKLLQLLLVKNTKKQNKKPPAYALAKRHLQI